MLLRAAILLVVTIVGMLPALLSAEWGGTEGRRVQIVREMVAANEWLVPTLGGQPTWAKPPLHYWVLGLFERLLGQDLWAMRLPAVLLLFLAALLAMELLRPWFGRRAGWVAALGMVLSPMALHEWPTAEIDPTFAAFTAMSLWLLATGVARGRRGLVLASGVLAGCAMLQKGVPFFMFAAGAYVVWWRRRNLVHAWLHFAPMLAIAAAYYVPVWGTKIPFSEWLHVAAEESVGRLKFFEWQHFVGIPGYWLRAIAIQLPFGLWCFWEWRGARDARMDAGDVTLRMCSSAAVVGVLVLTFFPGRATRYLLPNVLLFGFAVAPAVAHYSRQIGGLGVVTRRVVIGSGLLGALALFVLPFVPAASVGIPIAIVLALAPFAVKRPLHFVGFCLVLPLVSTFAIGFASDAGSRRMSSLREPAGKILRRELDALGATTQLETRGHVDSVVLLQAGLLPPGDESERLPPTRRWVLCEERENEQVRAIDGYVARLRVFVADKAFVVFERSETPR